MFWQREEVSGIGTAEFMCDVYIYVYIYIYTYIYIYICIYIHIYVYMLCSMWGDDICDFFIIFHSFQHITHLLCMDFWGWGVCISLHGTYVYMSHMYIYVYICIYICYVRREEPISVWSVLWWSRDPFRCKYQFMIFHSNVILFFFFLVTMIPSIYW